jgi:hypothetical protein
MWGGPLISNVTVGIVTIPLFSLHYQINDSEEEDCYCGGSPDNPRAT